MEREEGEGGTPEKTEVSTQRFLRNIDRLERNGTKMTIFHVLLTLVMVTEWWATEKTCSAPLRHLSKRPLAPQVAFVCGAGDASTAGASSLLTMSVYPSSCLSWCGVSQSYRIPKTGVHGELVPCGPTFAGHEGGAAA